MATQTITCLDEDKAPGRRRHSWHGSGLDVHTFSDGTEDLAHTRRCVWCGQEEVKRYGSTGGWLMVKAGSVFGIVKPTIPANCTGWWHNGEKVLLHGHACPVHDHGAKPICPRCRRGCYLDVACSCARGCKLHTPCPKEATPT